MAGDLGPKARVFRRLARMSLEAKNMGRLREPRKWLQTGRLSERGGCRQTVAEEEFVADSCDYGKWVYNYMLSRYLQEVP